jgi:hypothetical protein
MSRKPQSKDEAFEALDFIVNVLKEHEKDLDKLIGELGTVTEQFGATGDLAGKVEKVEEKVNGLQNEISNLANCLSTSNTLVAPTQSQQHGTPLTISEIKPTENTQPIQSQSQQAQQIQTAAVPPSYVHSIMQTPPVILRCKNWEDFQTLASQAATMSFMIKDAERTFQVDALKGNQIITYTGELPKTPALVKVWLGKQLDVSEKKILEGVLAIG